jgi:tripartite-type tricarboxylate transporter receptor subunit TctC
MAGNNGVEFVIEKYESYEAMRNRNTKLSMVAASCPTRLPQAPKVKTLKELGVAAPYVFNITVAHRDMPKARQQALSIILNNATLSVGKDEIYKLSAMRPPIFDDVSAQKFYDDSISVIYKLQVKYKQKIDDNKKL